LELETGDRRLAEEVSVSLQKKLGFGVLVGLLVAGSSLAQSFGVGAAIGLVNDVTDEFHVDKFKPKDLNLWLDYEVQERVIFRATLGTLRMKGVNAGLEVTPPLFTSPVTLPDLKNHVDYGTIGVSYLFAEGDYTSGLFAGFGGYKIRPDAVDEAIASYRDQRETVWGWHAGVDGGVRLVSRLTLMIRLTYHNIRASSVRSLLTANGGFAYRF
jgi:hypothetical protein